MIRKVVLDTNCLVQIISAHSPYRPAWMAFREGRYTLCVSNDILNEYSEILERVANAAVAHNIVNAIVRSPYTQMFDPHFHFGLIEQDLDDNKFVDCAIAGNASYIVSEDHHFNILKEIKFPNISVIGIDDFILILDSPNNMLANEPKTIYQKSK